MSTSTAKKAKVKGQEHTSFAQTPLFAQEGEGEEGGREVKRGPYVLLADEEEEHVEEDPTSPKAGLKRKLAFDEDSKRGCGSPSSEELDRDAVADKPTARTNRTTATKVSNSLVKKIINNQSGWDLKITGLIPFDQLERLCEALADNESTERLDLEGCAIGDRGCTLIRDLLIVTKHINHVDLQMNQITCVGCRTLAEGLPQNTTLHRLYVGNNNIRDEGVLALITSMRAGRELEINVSGNKNVTEPVLQRLDKALDKQWIPVRKPLSTLPPRPTRSSSVSIVKEDVRCISPSVGGRTGLRLASSHESAQKAGKEKEGQKDKEKEEKREAVSVMKRPRTEGMKNMAGREKAVCILEEEDSEKLRDAPSLQLAKVGEDVFRGAPLSYVFSDVKGGVRDGAVAVRWGRVRQSLKEQLDGISRELTIGNTKESLFETACAYLFGLHHASSTQSHNRGDGILMPPAPGKNWLSSEVDRRRAVEGSVGSLLLKFRHVIEDLSRELAFQTQSTPHPCPFKLSIIVHGPPPLGDTEYNV